MRTLAVVGTLVALASCSGSGHAPAPIGSGMAAYAKSIDVSKLDPTLRKQSLENWLRRGPTQAERLDWQESDCGLKPDTKEPPEGYPLCVKVVYERGQVTGWILVTVGTRRKGMVEPPRFTGAVASVTDGDTTRFEDVKALSELPRVVSKLLKPR
jgi:hypothetical protein